MAEGQSLTVEGLRRAVEAGEIDTVTVCTPDLHGKLMGKQVPAAAFVANLPRGVEISCSIYVYDDEQNVNEGFPEIGEQNGWADMAAVPDLDTLRRVAHLDRSAIVLADVWWTPERAVEVSPRTVLRRQVERAHAAGLRPARRRGVRVPRARRDASSRRGRRATAGCSRCTRRCRTTPSTASTATSR